MSKHRVPRVERVEAFIAHAQAMRVAETGRPLAASTVTSVRSLLNMVLARADGHTLDEVVTDRELATEVIEQLRWELTPLVAKLVVLKLAQYARWAVGDEAVVDRSDAGKAPIARRLDVPTPDEVTELLAAARRDGERTHVLIATLAHCGIRVGEALGLEWADVNVDAVTPHLLIRFTKNNRPRMVPLTPYLTALYQDPVLVDRLKSGAADRRRLGRDATVYVFPMSYEGARKTFHRMCDEAGLGESVTPHALRHAYVTRLLTAGVNAPVVQQLAGHVSIVTTINTYAHLMPLNHAADVARVFTTDEAGAS